jgi:hypothetical protein
MARTYQNETAKLAASMISAHCTPEMISAAAIGGPMTWASEDIACS